MKWLIKKCNTSACYSPFQMNQTVSTTLSEIFIPALSLNYGIYEFQLTVTMVAAPNLTTSASIYTQITATNIQVNLVQFGTSMIRQGYQRNFTLDPGKFSIDPDATTFNASVSWTISHHISDLFHRLIELAVHLFLSNLWSLQFPIRQWNTIVYRWLPDWSFESIMLFQSIRYVV